MLVMETLNYLPKPAFRISVLIFVVLKQPAHDIQTADRLKNNN